MSFKVVGDLILIQFDKDKVIYKYSGELTNQITGNTKIKQSCTMIVGKHPDILGLYNLTESYLNQLSESHGLDATIKNVDTQGTVILPNKSAVQIARINFGASPPSEVDDVAFNSISQSILNLIKNGIHFEVDEILLETITQSSCVWKFIKTVYYSGGKQIIHKNNKVTTHEKFDLFGLERFIEEIQIRPYFEFLKLREVSIIDEQNIGITKENNTFALCRTDKDYIDKLCDEEKALYTFVSVLSGKMEAKKADD